MPEDEKLDKEEIVESEDITEENIVDSIEPEETKESFVEEDSSSPSSTPSASKFEFENIDPPQEPVTVQSVKFASFENMEQVQGETNKNLDLLMDIKLQLTVELGRTELPIKKVLELTRGSIIELEKVAGEPVELYANGKLVAHGEVVVIEDNFGLRITSITDPDERLKGL